jgi:ubiquinone/menaquinone biosynthesis C-methylase UbiE
MGTMKESLPSRQEIVQHLGSEDFFFWECYGAGFLGRVQAWIFRSRLMAVLRFLHSSHPAPTTILDVGCGPMFIAYPLLQGSTRQYVGVDTMRPARLKKYRSAIKSFGIESLEAVRASAEFLPFRSNTYDLVLCLDVLEHLKEPKKASLELSRVSRGGALLLVSLPLENVLQKSSRLGFALMKLFGEPLARRAGHVPVTRTPEYHYRGSVKSYGEMLDELTGILELSNTEYTPIGFHRSLNMNAIHAFHKPQFEGVAPDSTGNVVD